MKRPIAAVLAVTAITAGVVWWAVPPEAPLEAESVAASPASPAPPPPRPQTSSPPAQVPSPAGSSTPTDSSAERERQRLRLARAEHTLREYRLATRYPPDSRPAREHPDQMEPPAPERRMAFEEDGVTDDDAAALYLVLRQDRVFVSGTEAVNLSLRCEDRRGGPVRCEVMTGSATEPPREGQPPLAPVPVPFHDDGSGADAAPGDGTFTARFSPGREGFLASGGTVRIAVSANAGAARRDAFFDILYTGLPPARFTGTVEERIEDGSLALDVGLEVKRPGRYVITARVDDAKGNPFAWLQFNEELPAGTQRARLTVFGKLILDEQPAFPLRVRDVEGFLLKELGDPDRELMETLSGPVHTTRRHPLARFSDAEWSSEQRSRYLAELERDVERAEEALAGAP